MPRLITAIAFWFLAACSSLQTRTLEPLPLPLASDDGCCWQAQQSITVHYENETHNLQAALARSQQGPGLVLLSPLGQRLLSVHQENNDLVTWRATQMPERIPARFFLAVSMLAWWPDSAWQNLPPSWQLETTSHSRTLKFRGRPWLRIDYQDSESSQRGLTPRTDGPVTIKHYQLPLSMTVRTVKQAAL